MKNFKVETDNHKYLVVQIDEKEFDIYRLYDDGSKDCSAFGLTPAKLTKFLTESWT